MSGFKGGVDGFRNGRVGGWIVPTEEIIVEIGGVRVDSFVPNALRPDVVAAGVTENPNIGISYNLDWEKIAVGDTLNFAVSRGEALTSLPGAPVNLEPIRQNAKQLRNFLAVPPFVINGVERVGDDLIFKGNLISVSRNGELELNLLINGKPFDSIEWSAADPATKQYFWFVPTGKSAFTGKLHGAASQSLVNEYHVQPVFASNNEPVAPYLYLDIPATLPHNLPGAEAQHRVMGWSNDFWFSMYGRTHKNTIVNLINKHKAVSDWASVSLLDWGCGCGRIVRHFLDSDTPLGRLVGVDIDAVNINWCNKNLSGAEFYATGLQPPLPFENDSFDFVHGNSVFTHLNDVNQDLWLAEIKRILKPGGIAMLTVNSKGALAYGSADSLFIGEWESSGIYFPGHNTNIDEVISDHSYYYDTFHTHAYVRTHWSKFLDLLEIYEIVFGYQDVVVLRKT